MIYIGATIQTKGNHYYIVVDTYDENGKRKPKWIATGLEIKGNKRKAEEKRKEIEREYELKSKLVPSDITLDELAQKWVDEYIKQSRYNHIWRIRKYCKSSHHSLF